MGSFEGHFLPGAFFFLQGLWWWANVLKLYCKSCQTQRSISVSFKTTTWFPISIKWFGGRPIEPIIRFCLGTIGIFVELIPENSFILIGKDGEFEEEHLNNYGHASMYTIFAIWALVEVLMYYNVVQLPACSEFLFASLALFVEGILFFFHLDGRPKLDKLFHTFLYLIIFMSAVVMVLEGWMKDSFLLMVARVFLFLLQGTWFIQIAHSLHGSTPWKSIKPNQEFVAIVFSWHVILLLVLMVVGFVALSLKVNGCDCRKNRPRRHEDDNMIEIENISDCEQDRRVLIEEEDPAPRHLP